MPRLSELLNSRVIDVDGTDVGKVHDVRLVQDGPLVEGFGNALRLDGLVIGGPAIAARLGFNHHNITGPLLLKAIFDRIDRKARYARWVDVAEHGNGTITLTIAASQLEMVP